MQSRGVDEKYEMHLDSDPSNDVARPATLIAYLNDVSGMSAPCCGGKMQLENKGLASRTAAIGRSSYALLPRRAVLCCSLTMIQLGRWTPWQNMQPVK
eukprot:symbB.v1.2.006007.t1/scaffold356.1/size220710/4